MGKKLVFANNPLLSGPALNEREGAGIPYREVPIGSIDRDPNQPRVNFDETKLSELAESIRTYGVLSPILVRPGKVPGRYHLVAGERRLRASKLVGLSTIPAILDTESGKSDERALAIQLVENIQRDDLTPLERAHAFDALKVSHELSVREVAARVGVSKSMVQRSLELLNLPDDLLNALRQGASESKVLLLSKVTDASERAKYLRDLDGLTRSQLEQQLGGSKRPEKSISSKSRSSSSSPEDDRIAEEMQRALGTKVKLLRKSANSDAGRLTIDFYSEDDLQAIFRKLVSED